MSRTVIRDYYELPGELWTPVREVYQQAMRPLAIHAANRHQLTDTEMVAMFFDHRITKWVAASAHSDCVAFGTTMTDLTAWPLIEPAYFRHRWPEEYDAHRIWYVGFVVTNKRTPGAFADLIREMSHEPRTGGGLMMMDFCDYNVEERNAPAVVERVLTSPYLHQRQIDAQRFWMFSFDKPEVIS